MHMNKILQRAGDQEILLLQAQLFTCLFLIIRIENFGYIFSCDFIFHRAKKVTPVEILKIKPFGCLGFPQPE